MGLPDLLMIQFYKIKPNLLGLWLGKWALFLTLYISIYKHTYRLYMHVYVDGLVQERHNFIAEALGLCLSCTNPSIYYPCLSNCLPDKHSQSHPSIFHATHPSLHEFTATLSDSPILLSFPPYIHPFFFLSFSLGSSLTAMNPPIH